MPVFQVDLKRTVSRVVELDQTSAAYVDAPDVMTAKNAADQLCRDFDIDKYCGKWQDIDASRFATNDDEVRRPRVERVCPARAPKRWAVSAAEILKLDPETEE